ncbi:MULTISPECIES: hypothetical protein [Pontibacter]|nr:MULTISPECIES: hypothetical protein [Pontibacter]
MGRLQAGNLHLRHLSENCRRLLANADSFIYSKTLFIDFPDGFTV